MTDFWQFLLDNADKLGEQTMEHIGLTFISLLLAAVLAVPLGIYITRHQRWAGSILAGAGVLQTIPSIALLGFLIPVLGIGFQPAIVALFLYAILPILRNVYTGIQGVDTHVVQAARGMGLSDRQLLWRVQLPLAMPVIFAGLRTAAVINVGVATLAAYIGAGGLGEFIFGGIALNNTHMILAGAIPAAVLAVGIDQLLHYWQQQGVGGRRQWLPLVLLPLLSSFYWVPQRIAPGWAAAFEAEFMGRRDGYDHLRETYPEVAFRPTVLNQALMYEALRAGQVDIICGYSTEGRIRAFDLRVLEDDRQAFPPYQCGLLASAKIMEQAPALRAALDRLVGLLSDSTMTELNYRVDFEQQAPAAVARAFLETTGLYRPDRAQGGATFTIGSKIFTEQYILAELFALLVDGYTDWDAVTLPGLGGTKICFDALRNGEIDAYPEYSGTALLVLLQPTAVALDALGDDPLRVYTYVQSELAKQHALTYLEPLGFNNTYALIVRREQAERENWLRVSDVGNDF